MTPQEVLTKAADLIEAAPKLAKGVYSMPAGNLNEEGRRRFRLNAPGPLCYCAVGAIRAAADFHSVVADEATWLLAESLDLELKPAVYAWNDGPDRTKAEVVAALRKAAEQ